MRFLGVSFFFLMSLCSWVSSATAAIVQTGTLWPQNHLQVCFTDSKEILKSRALYLRRLTKTDTETLDNIEVGPLDSELKTLIQAAVEKSFSSEKTGIVFEGWGTCTGNEEVAIFYVLDDLNRDPNQNREVAAGSIGVANSHPLTSIRINRSDIDGFRSDNIMPSLERLMNWAYGAEKAKEQNWNQFAKFAFIKDIVHEFGHIAGLIHEQIRFDLDGLKKIDISLSKDYSDEIQGDNEYIKKIWEIVPPPTRQEFGIANPISAMNYMTMWYALAAEKTRLICKMTRQEHLPSAAVTHFSGMYRDLIKIKNAQGVKIDKAFSLVALNEVFCKDRSYLILHPKVQFDRGTLFDTQSQNALKSVYLKVPFEDIGQKDLNLIRYIQSVWGAMTDMIW